MSRARFRIINYLPHAEYYLKLGIEKGRSGNLNEAILNFHKAICLKPNWMEPYGHLAWAYFNKGLFYEAEKIYLRLIQAKPFEGELFCILSNINKLQNHPNKAYEYLSKAISIDPDIENKYQYQKISILPKADRYFFKSLISLKLTVFGIYRNLIILWCIEKLLIAYRFCCIIINYIFVYIWDFLRDHITDFYNVPWKRSDKILVFSLRSLLLFFHKYRVPFYYGGIYYPRNIETPLALTWLAAEPGQKVLEIGTGLNVLTCALAEKGCQLYCTDADPYILKLKEYLLETQLKSFIEENKLRIEIVDGRKLPYPDESFDRVISISTIEHFPEEGDKEMAYEIARVLKPGGLAVITTEMEAEYREVWTEMPFYTGFQYQYPDTLNVQNEKYESDVIRKKSMGFYRFYDRKSVLERIVVPSGLSLLDFIFIGDIFPIRKYMEPNAPRWKRLGLTHFSSLMACLFFHKIPEEKVTPRSSGIVGNFILEKPLK